MQYIPYQRYTKKRAREHRRNQTPAEKIVWEKLLRKDKTGYRFLRQKRIGYYILDFYCSKLLLCIEIDGSSHYGREAYDARRTRFLNSLGIKVVRYANKTVYTDLNTVELDIQSVILARSYELVRE